MRSGQSSIGPPEPLPYARPRGKSVFRADPVRLEFTKARTRDLISWLRARRSRCGVSHAGLPRSTNRSASGRGNPSCIRCNHPRTHRWGSFRGRQRWRCLGCRRTFSDLTGTIFYRTWEPGAWLAFVEHLKETPTVRESASQVGINKDTALRWRHRLLDALGTAPQGGSKSRNVAQPEHSDHRETGASMKAFVGMLHPFTGVRGTETSTGGREGIWLLLVRELAANGPDETGGQEAVPTGTKGSHDGIVLQRIIHRRPGSRPAEAISAHLTALRRDPARLLPHGRDRHVLRRGARWAGWETSHPLRGWADTRRISRAAGSGEPVMKSAKAEEAERGRARVGFCRLNRYVGQFMAWLRRFRGVATANLQRYMDWYLAILTPDTALRPGVSRAQALLVLASRPLDPAR